MTADYETKAKCLPTYTAKLRRLSVNTAHGRANPRTICMLLAVFDLARGRTPQQPRPLRTAAAQALPSRL